jgi:hypothetical protein
MSEFYTASEHVSWKQLDAGRSIMLDLRSGRYYTLNETATGIWEHLTHASSVQDVVQELARTFEVDAAEIEKDVRDLVNSLSQKGFLTKAEAPAEMPEANPIAAPGVSYVRPILEEHEAVTEVTAGTDDYSSCGYGVHYWYPN